MGRIHYLTIEEVLAAHFFVMEQTDDSDQAGIRDYGLLESAVRRPQQSIMGEDAYPTVFLKAAALLESLIKNHPFFNGNKRTAFLAAIGFLKANQYEFVMDLDEAVEFTVGIVVGKHLSVEEIAKILESWCSLETDSDG